MIGEKYIREQHREVSMGHTFLTFFLNDLNPIGLDNVSLIKYADVSSLLIAVNEQRDHSEMLHRSS